MRKRGRMRNEPELRRGCRFLATLAVASFALTMLLGSAAAAQDEVTTQQPNNPTAADPARADDSMGNRIRPNSDNFRCESFLREFRNNRDAVRAQYSNAELVRRFEQCLSGDVLRNTIPNRNLPFTGGPPLLAAGLALLSLVAAAIAVRLIKR
jgi:hypothetical protein